MFRFEDPAYFWYLMLLFPLAAMVYWAWVQRKEKMTILGDAGVVSSMVSRFNARRWWTKQVLFFIGVAFALLALTNPQMSGRSEQIESTSANIYIALDISQSMLAQDLTPSRLEKAKRLARNLVQGLKGNRMGIINFAGSAYLQSPLTSDRGAVEMMLATANPDQAGTQGTAISLAIALANRSFANAGTTGIIIVISDGETHDEESLDQAELALKAGNQVYVIGVGTPQGANIPVFNGREVQSLTDENGEVVVSKLNMPFMQELASRGGGKAYLLQEEAQALSGLKEGIRKFEKTESIEQAFRNYENYFYVILAFSLVFFLLYFLIDYTESKGNA